MEIVFLGTGTGVPSAHRASPALALICEGRNLMVDAGPGALRQLVPAGLSYNDLDYIFFTHFHPDHFSDFVPYLFATRYWPGFIRREPARIYGPQGLLEKHERLKGVYGHWIEPPDDSVVMTELPAGKWTSFDCPPWKVEAGPLPHTPESLGYRLTGPDGAVAAVTGDTDFGPELVDLARGADLLITECSLPEKREGHLTPNLAGRAARQAGAKALALTHFYPQTDGLDLFSLVRQEFDGPVTLAEDLMRIIL